MNQIQAEAQERVEIKHQLKYYGAIGWRNEDDTDYLLEVLDNKKEELRKKFGY
jgi:hypothetical protein